MSNDPDRKDRFWDLFLTGGWSSFNREWRRSRSRTHTVLLFLSPVVAAGMIILLALLASTVF